MSTGAVCLRAAEGGLKYADLLLQRGGVLEALDLLKRLRIRSGVLARVDRIGLMRLLAKALVRTGDAAEAERALSEALPMSTGTAWEPVLLSEMAALRSDRTEQNAVAQLYLSGGWPESPPANEHFEEILNSRADELDAHLRTDAIAWAHSRGRLLLLARLLDAAGDRAAALGVLDQVLQSDDAEQRVPARLLRVAILPEGEVEQRRAEIDAIEAEVADPLTLPGTSLCDLAAACGLATEGELGWSNRAIWYAQHAYARSEGQGWRAHAARTWVRLVRDRVAMTGTASTPDPVSAVSGLLPALTSLTQASARLAHELVAALLLDGPLTHPERVTVALSVLDRLDGGPTVGELRARAESIRRVVNGEASQVAPLPDAIDAKVPFDDAPHIWFVDVIARGRRYAPPAELLERPEQVMLAAIARPDRADSLLAQ